MTPLTKSISRLSVLGLIFCGWALVVLLRLFSLQIISHDQYARLGLSQQERLISIDAPRGSILDRDGHYLALNSASQFAVVNPRRIPKKDIAAALLARVLGLDAEKLQLDIEAAAMSRHHRGYFVADPHVSPEKAEELRALKLDWLEIRNGSLRTYPNGQLASHVIGEVNGEGHGAAGVELKLEKDLAGTPGQLRVKIDVRQHPYASELAKAPTIGKNIGLTIDSQLQHIAEDAIKTAVIKNHGVHGSIVALDPRNGEILALANYPTYDANQRLHAGETSTGRENLAVVAPYEPGSVFKVITLSAALETTNLTPDTMINCGSGVIRLYGRVIHDSHPYSVLSMADVLAKSSNIGAIHVGLAVGNQNMYNYVRRFGIGQRTNVELPAEAPGMLRPLRRWQLTSLPSVAMGHEVSVTTVQLARVASVFANGGFLVYPHVVAWKQEPGGPKQFVNYAPLTQVLAPQTVMTMRQLMRRVVISGTAKNLHLVGYTLAGKTGTAQIFDFAHHVYTHKYNASFMGFAPMNNPKVLVVVTVSGTVGTAGFGSLAAGPAFETVANAALRLNEVPRDVPEEIQELEQKQLLAEAKLKGKIKEVAQTDDVADPDLATPLTPEEVAASQAGPDPATQITVLDANLTGPKVPNFVGKTVKDVMQEAAGEGLDVDLFGEGMARAQSMPAGAFYTPGEHIRVTFKR